jgi:hypothetical protein
MSEKSPRDGYFVVDAAYLKKEAREALRTFFAPVLFVWRNRVTIGFLLALFAATVAGNLVAIAIKHWLGWR